LSAWHHKKTTTKAHYEWMTSVMFAPVQASVLVLEVPLHSS
jgi:hypothetical protein